MKTFVTKETRYVSKLKNWMTNLVRLGRSISEWRVIIRTWWTIMRYCRTKLALSLKRGTSYGQFCWTTTWTNSFQKWRQLHLLRSSLLCFQALPKGQKTSSNSKSSRFSFRTTKSMKTTNLVEKTNTRLLRDWRLWLRVRPTRSDQLREKLSSPFEKSSNAAN